MSLSSFMDEIRKIPPVTRFLGASTLAVSLPVMLQLVSPYSVLFVKRFVVENFQLWRMYTSFFYAGSGITFLFEFIMLSRNSLSLETGHYPGRSADYAWQLLIAAFAIIGLNIPLKSFLHFRPLLMSILYLTSCLTPTAMVSIMGLINIPNKYFPYALLGMDLVTGGTGAAASSLTGLIAGHAWWYLVHSDESGRPGRAYATAPAWLWRIVGDGPEVAGAARGGRVVGAATAAAREATQRTTGYNWGTGNRLGDS
ncbi:DER1-domain-containing protein [Rickenella mellea]|uniref:Derlin n=1 Tax=Rickenella mellea TaxID=50990 RepID=A0A4Y7Q341_9AGAM|nr:DER1-domain-containing protein [Rickenella mellea]